MTEKVCSICGGTERVQQSPAWLNNYNGLWCYYCFLAWYDHRNDDYDQVKERSLKMQKAWMGM